jgi:Phage protein D
MKTRRVTLNIQYDNADISNDIKEYITAYSYTDVASGSSDDLNITVENRDKKWMDTWSPDKGAKLITSIAISDWDKEGDSQVLECGKFVIDDLSFSGAPFTASIGALSIPVNMGFKDTKNSKVWQGVSLNAIASEIATNAGIELFFDGEDIVIGDIEQQDKSDSEFLYGLCKDYGMALKVYSEKLVIFSEMAYEAKEPVATISVNDMEKFSLNDTLTGIYTGAKLSYSNPKDNNLIEVTIGEGSKFLELSEKVDDIKDAERKATSKLRAENKKATTLKFTAMGNIKVIASCVISITGLNKYDGKYYVDKVVHNVGSGGRYVINVDSHKILVPIIPPEPPAPVGTEYVVKSGDNLWNIARTFLGAGKRWGEIYEINKEVIQAEAAKRNKPGDGNWIWPGMVLIIPN